MTTPRMPAAKARSRRALRARLLRCAAVPPLALALAGWFGPAGPVRAQDALEDVVPTGPAITATIGQRFEVDSNLGLDDPSPGTSYFTDTLFGLGILNETPAQVFSLDFETALRALWEADEDFELTFGSPTEAEAGYSREWANAALQSSFGYRQQRVDFDRDLDDFLDPDLGVPVLPDDPDEIEEESTERRYDASVGLDLATDSPSSYGFGLAGTRFDYSDESDDLTPRDTVEGFATWTLQFTPLLASQLTGRYQFYSADDDEETEIREAEVDAGVIYTPNALLQLSAGLGFVDREQEELVGGSREVVENDSGLAVRTGLRYLFEDVQVNANLRWTEVPDSRLSGDLRFVYPLVNSRVTGRVFRSYAGGSGGDEIEVTGAAIGLLRELDQVSRVEFDLAASRRVNQDEPDDPDTDRLTFTTTYSYDFSEVLTGDVGYRYRRLNEDPDEADSHAVFVGISRSFETRP